MSITKFLLAGIFALATTASYAADEAKTCCEKARARGRDCSHPCCVKAKAAGKACAMPSCRPQK